MFKKLVFSAATVVFTFSFATAQVDVTKPVTVSGIVKSVEGDKLFLETAKGPTTMVVAATAVISKVPASNPNPAAATPSTIGEIVAGDRVVMSALPMADGTLNPARRVLVISQSDIAAKQKSLSDAWRTRGVSGQVESVNAETKQITVKTTGTMGAASTIVLTPKAEAKFLKYASNSVKYTDAKPSTLAQITKGDAIRALGDKSADGASFQAEEILTASHQQLDGTIKSVDAASGEIVITERITKKDLTVSLANASTMKRFPAEMAARLSGAGAGTGAAGNGSQAGQTPPAGAGAMQGQPGAGRPGVAGQRGGNLENMLDRLPAETIAGLKVGEMIVVVAERSEPDAKVAAFTLLAGVESFVRMAEMRAAAQGGGRRGGSQVGLQIPGLDGFTMP